MAKTVGRARRSFWILMTLWWVLATLPTLASSEPIVRLGLFTDLHAHDIDSPAERKWMSNTEDRLLAFVDAMNDWSPDFVIELGDFVNGWVVLGTEPGSPDRIPHILTWARDLLGGVDGPIHHVIGNHDVYNLDKTQYLQTLGMASTSYSFTVGAYHFLVLDVQYKEDGTDLAHTYTGVAGYVPDRLLEWMAEELAATELPTVVFVHQPLDDHIERWGSPAGRPTVGNQAAVIDVLTGAGNVIAVFQGHTHRNAYNVIEGIHFVTFAALVDQDTPPTWAQVTLDSEAQIIRVEGVGRQASYELPYTLRPSPGGSLVEEVP